MRATYPGLPMKAHVEVFLEAFRLKTVIDEGDPDKVEYQRACALQQGAAERVRTVGGLKGHDAQAAALLVAISDLDVILEMGLARGDRDEYRKKFSDELRHLAIMRRTLAHLLDWHLLNGAGRLLPIAQDLGLYEEAYLG